MFLVSNLHLMESVWNCALVLHQTCILVSRSILMGMIKGVAGYSNTTKACSKGLNSSHLSPQNPFKMTTKTFSIVEFDSDNAVEVVPSAWILVYKGGTKCQFPDPIPINVKLFQSNPVFVPPQTWPVYRVSVISNSGMLLSFLLFSYSLVL